MQHTGRITSSGEGVLEWNVGYFEILFEKEFDVWSPRFPFSGHEYQIELRKKRDDYCIKTLFRRPDFLRLPNLCFEFHLRDEDRRVSPSYSSTVDETESNCVFGGMSPDKFGRFPQLTLSLRMRTHHALEPVVAQENSNTEEDSEAENVKKLQEDLKKLLHTGEDADVTLKVQGQSFRAHRSILRSRSPVFKPMFAHDMEEKISGTVTIEDCDPKSFPDFLEHLYTGRTGHVAEGNVCQLYAASDKYEVAGLKSACLEFMRSHFSVDSFCDFLTLSLMHSEQELIDRATEFFCSNALEITRTVKWQIFLRENSTAGNELFVKFCQMQSNT